MIRPDHPTLEAFLADVPAKRPESAAGDVPPACGPQPRLLALDAYRGFVMLALASGGLGLASTAGNFPDSAVWQQVGHQFEHVTWRGCTFWDLIQPSFMYIVGVAMAFSCAARAAKGHTYARMLGHVLVRSVLLVLLGVFLRSSGAVQTNWTFIDVVTQIGLGYPLLFLLWNRRPRTQLAAAALILAGYWCVFYFYPLPPRSFDYAAVGVDADWQHLEGIEQHWDKNTNPAAAVDRWFLNLFPRREPFEYDSGGYTTLNFVPALATMILGLVAGGLLRSNRPQRSKFWILVGAGLAGLAAGMILDRLGVCPIVKRIWTPSWALFSAGWTTLMLAGFYGVVELAGWRRWTFPLVVVGANSILIYCMSHLSVRWIVETLQTHLGRRAFEVAGPDVEPLVRNLAVLAVLWLVCYWLYRRKVFIRI